MNNKDKMMIHTGALVAYAVMYQFPEVNSDAFGWAVFCALVGVSVVGLWRAAAREIARTMEDVRRG